MTRRSILEYTQALRSRYFRSSREEKGKMLDEFVQVTGFHRKAAIRLLNRVSQLAPGKRELTGQKIEIKTTSYYSILSIDGREYYFIKETGEFDGTSFQVKEN